MTVSKRFSISLIVLSVFVASAFVIYHRGYERGFHDRGVSGEVGLIGDALSGSDSMQSQESNGRGEEGTGVENQSAAALTPMHGWLAGYELAALDFDSAVAQAEGLPYHQQLGFVTGVFSYVSENRSPSEALEFVNEQAGQIRDIGLKTLVAKWMLDGGDIENENEHWESLLSQGTGTLGLEVGLSARLANANLDPEIEQAWRNAFSNHPGRTEIAARFAASRAATNPDFSLEMDDRWTDWEKERFTDSVLNVLTRTDPSVAWEWYENNDYERTQRTTAGVLNSWGQRDPQQLSEAFEGFENPRDRKMALGVISSRLPTLEAMDWAEGLADAQEREYAIEQVQKNALTGIGATLSSENGYAKIVQIIPGGALESTSLQVGDILIEARQGGGEPVDLYGRGFGSIIGTLRGEYGTTVEIRVLRPNEATGNLEEHAVTVERGLVLPQK